MSVSPRTSDCVATEREMLLFLLKSDASRGDLHTSSAARVRETRETCDLWSFLGPGSIWGKGEVQHVGKTYKLKLMSLEHAESTMLHNKVNNISKKV